MASARDIKRKINSVQNTQKITKAMKMVSAAKMRRAIEAMMSARPYAELITGFIKDIAGRSGGDVHCYFKARPEVKSIGLILVTSDRGLCGAFNSNVIKAAANFCAAHQGKDIKLYLVGKRAFDFFKKRSVTIADKWTGFGGKYRYDDAALIGSMAVKAFNEEEVDEVYVIYNEFKSTSSQIVREKKILPVAMENEGAQAYPDFEYEPDRDRLLDELLPQFINTSVYQSMLESAAGEHGARMVAMDNATRNAGEMIKKLVLNYNKARQGAITKELLDIVNGAEALK